MYISLNKKSVTPVGRQTMTRLQTTVKKHAKTNDWRVFEHENKMKMSNPITSNNTLLGKWMGDANALMSDKVP